MAKKPYKDRVEYYSKRYKENPEKFQIYRDANKEKHKNYTKEYYRKNRDKSLSSALKVKYGITLQEKLDMIKEQNNECGNLGCKELPTCVDHDHKTGLIRSILCHGCNSAFGLLKENITRISGLLKYGEFYDSSRS